MVCLAIWEMLSKMSRDNVYRSVFNLASIKRTGNAVHSSIVWMNRSLARPIGMILGVILFSSCAFAESDGPMTLRGRVIDAETSNSLA